MNNGASSQPLSTGAAEKRELALVRPLGYCERFFYLYSLAFPVHFCLVAQIEGAFDSVRLAAALEQVRNRHSALRVCIVDDAETGLAFHRTDNPIALHAAPAETAADWRRVVERELSLPFNTFPGPLMRATALWASDGTSIVLTFHHAIVDALSGTRILQDVMRALAGQSLEVLPPLPPVEKMIAGFAPIRSSSERGLLATISQKPAAGLHKGPKGSRRIWRLRNGIRKRRLASCDPARQTERPCMAQSVQPPHATFQPPTPIPSGCTVRSTCLGS
jgi:hypothetical protein